jgi:hypothetical protein
MSISVSLDAQKCDMKGRFYESPDIITSSEIKIERNRTEKADSTNPLRIETLISLTGSQKYLLDKSISVINYKYIVIHCTKWNHSYVPLS